MKRPNPPRHSQIESESRQSKGPRTLAGDLARIGNVFRKTSEFISDHKWQTLGVIAVALTLGGGLARWSADANHAADIKADQQAQEDFKHDIDSVAVQIANIQDVVPGSTIDNPGNHLYDLAREFADANGIDHQENGVDTLLESAVAISKANYIQPDSSFVISMVDTDHNEETEPIPVVQLAPEELETLNQ